MDPSVERAASPTSGSVSARISVPSSERSSTRFHLSTRRNRARPARIDQTRAERAAGARCRAGEGSRRSEFALPRGPRRRASTRRARTRSSGRRGGGSRATKTTRSRRSTTSALFSVGLSTTTRCPSALTARTRPIRHHAESGSGPARKLHGEVSLGPTEELQRARAHQRHAMGGEGNLLRIGRGPGGELPPRRHVPESNDSSLVLERQPVSLGGDGTRALGDLRVRDSAPSTRRTPLLDATHEGWGGRSSRAVPRPVGGEALLPVTEIQDADEVSEREADRPRGDAGPVDRLGRLRRPQGTAGRDLVQLGRRLSRASSETRVPSGRTSTSVKAPSEPVRALPRSGIRSLARAMPQRATAVSCSNRLAA